MAYEFDNIVHRYYEGVKLPFLNFMLKKYEGKLDYDTIMSIYNDVWIDVRQNIRNDRVQLDTKWKSYIFKIGINKANNLLRNGVAVDSFDAERFNEEAFEKEYYEQKEAERTVYENPELVELLGRELSFMPDTCQKILQMYYYWSWPMDDIAAAMNYNNADVAKASKLRCMGRLKARLKQSACLLGLIS